MQKVPSKKRNIISILYLNYIVLFHGSAYDYLFQGMHLCTSILKRQVNIFVFKHT